MDVWKIIMRERACFLLFLVMCFFPIWEVKYNNMFYLCRVAILTRPATRATLHPKFLPLRSLCQWAPPCRRSRLCPACPCSAPLARRSSPGTPPPPSHPLQPPPRSLASPRNRGARRSRGIVPSTQLIKADLKTLRRYSKMFLMMNDLSSVRDYLIVYVYKFYFTVKPT